MFGIKKEGTKKEGTMDLKTSKLAVKKVISGEKGKSKVRIMFFEVKVQERWVLLMKLEVNLEKTAEIKYLEAKKQETSLRVIYLQVSKLEKR